MTSTLAVKLKPVSGQISIPILNGEPDLDKLVQQHAASLIPLVGKVGIYLGVFYDLNPDPGKFDPAKANVDNGRYNLPLDIQQVESGLHLKITEADIAGVKEFLSQRAQLEQQSRGATRLYVNAIFYQAE